YFKFTLYLLLILAVCTSCETEYGDRRNIRKFYFPIADLDDGLVYEYQAVGNDSFPPVYWYYRNIKQKDGLYLVGTAYGADLLPTQLITEAVVDNGMLLEDMYLFANDTLGKQVQVTVNIESGSAFPFLVKDEKGVFLYKVNWSMPDSPDVSTTLIKNRRFVGDTTYMYEGQSHPAVIFSVQELVEQRASGSLELSYEGTEIYAKNIGLVQVSKDIHTGMTQTYALARTYPMSALEAKFRQLTEETEDGQQNNKK
ncbi:MAG: hypothetical protein AAGK47_05515, partial [Bacteroidota bacterium]